VGEIIVSKKICLAETKNRLRHIAESLFIIEYPREYEPIFKTASTCEPEDPLGTLYFMSKKTEGRKSRNTVQLTS
jgi:hypothetical protein